MENIKIETEFIKLDQLLKWCGVVGSGTDAKILIKNEVVKVNGEIETRRGKKIYSEDVIEVDEKEYKIIEK